MSEEKDKDDGICENGGTSSDGLPSENAVAPDVYQEVTAVAKKKKISVSAFVISAVALVMAAVLFF